jgi:hypothetical protein
MVGSGLAISPEAALGGDASAADGFGAGAEVIRHRLRAGLLHRVMRGVYSVGRRGLDTRGRWMAATLVCGPHALLSHRSAAALLGICGETGGRIDVVVPDHVVRRRPGIRVHRRAGLLTPGSWAGRWAASGSVDRIPVTGPVPTLVDLAMCLSTAELEAAVNEASQRDLVDPESLREALDSIPVRPGVARLRRLLDRDTFVVTETLARFRPRRRDRQPPLSPDACHAGRGQSSRPGPCRGRFDGASLQPLAGSP